MSRVCRECKWFSYQRNPETGRVLPSQRGECGAVDEYKQKVFAIVPPRPSYDEVKTPFIEPVTPWDTSDCERCAWFTPKQEKKPRIEGSHHINGVQYTEMIDPRAIGRSILKEVKPKREPTINDPDADLHEHM